MKRTEGEVVIKERGTNLFGISAESKRVCIIADLGHETQEDIANADHIAVTWNASKGMTTKQAGLYLEHGAEMVDEIQSLLTWATPMLNKGRMSRMVEVEDKDIIRLKRLVALMEGK